MRGSRARQRLPVLRARGYEQADAGSLAIEQAGHRQPRGEVLTGRSASKSEVFQSVPQRAALYTATVSLPVEPVLKLARQLVHALASTARADCALAATRGLLSAAAARLSSAPAAVAMYTNLSDLHPSSNPRAG